MATDYSIPFKTLVQATTQMGFVDINADSDGVFRRVDLFRQYNSQIYPALSIAAAFDYFQVNSVLYDSQRFLKLHNRQIPLTKDHQYLVKMKHNFPVFSASDVLQSIKALQDGRIEDVSISPSNFKDKLIFFGVSTEGSHDLLNSSIASNTPAIYVHASILDNILTKDFYHTAPLLFSVLLSLLIIFTTGYTIFYITRVDYQIILLSFIGGSLITSHLLAFIYFSTVLLFIFPLAAYLFMILNSYVYLSVTEGTEKRKVVMLSKYVSPNVLSGA